MCIRDRWIYVDSLSTDGSIGIALKHGAKVYSLEADPSLCPASGRCAGTLEAAGRWILYLDGDMVLRKEFIAFLDYLKKEETNMPAKTAGFVGKTCSRFIDQASAVVSCRDNVCIPARFSGKEGPWGRTADYHGGAVLYLSLIHIFSVQIRRQFHPDGTNFEASTGYHRLTTEILYSAALMLLQLDRERRERLLQKSRPGEPDFSDPLIFPVWFWVRALKAVEYLAALLKPDGKSPQLGDFDNGRFHKPVSYTHLDVYKRQGAL